MAESQGIPKEQGVNRVPNPLRIDPTRTTGVRRAFIAALKGRFARLRAKVYKLVAEEDAFGLKQPSHDPFTVNRRWAYRPDAEKVRAFRDWLRTQIGQDLTGQAEEELWKRYVEEGFRRGAGRAFDDVNRAKRFRPGQGDFYAGSREQFLRSSFGRPVAVEKVKLLASRAYDDLEGVTSAMSTAMVRTLADGLVEGKNPRDIAADLVADVDGIGQRRATLIAQDAIIRTHAEGQLTAFEDLGVEELGVAAEWSSAGDDRVCESCFALEGVVLKVAEARGMLPRHPGCLPGDGFVLSRSRIAAASKRWHDGDLVVIRTASGRELACTPNHPVLTNAGWAPARLLDVGRYVICDGGREWESGFVNNHHKNVPARIEEVAAAFAESREVVAEQVPLSTPHFHGDGMNGDVAVVWTDRQLRGSGQAAFAEHGRQGALGARGERIGVSLPTQRSVTQLLPRTLSAKGRFVRRRSLAFPLLGSRPRPFQDFGLALVASGDASQYEDSCYCSARYLIPMRNDVFRVPASVCSNHFIDRQIGEPSDYPVVGAQNTLDDFVRDAELARKISGGAAGPVFADKIISVLVKKFFGHVFNLETDAGFYSANGIITHNCRCAWLPAGVGEDDDKQKDTKREIDRAIRESVKRGSDDDWVGGEKRIGKVRPKSILD